MALDPNSLMQHVYDFFENIYKTAPAAPGGVQTYFCFDGGGQPLFDGDFKLHPADPDYNTGVAAERFSHIVNVLPTGVDSQSFIPSINLVDQFYPVILDSITGVFDTTDADGNKAMSVTPSLAMAKRLVTASELQSFPAFATPTNWYDARLVKNWPSYSFQSTQITQNQASNYYKLGPPLEITNPGIWRVKPDTSVLVNSANTQSKTPMAGKLPMGPRIMLRPGTEALVNRTSAENTPGESGVTNAAVPMVAHSMVMDVRADAVKSPVETLSPVERMNVFRFINQHSTPQVASTDSITVSFNYCYVNIARPWIFSPLFYMQNWYSNAFAAGSLSTGVMDTGNNMPFAAVPIGFIVISNLNITAQWSQNDLEIAKQASAFGPFSLYGNTVTQNSNGATISCAGMQIIGWINQVTPLLPPLNAPVSLITNTGNTNPGTVITSTTNGDTTAAGTQTGSNATSAVDSTMDNTAASTTIGNSAGVTPGDTTTPPVTTGTGPDNATTGSTDTTGISATSTNETPTP